MNRREILKTLAALPSVTAIQRADIGPHDVIVIETDECVDLEGAEHIRQALTNVWPGRKVIVLGSGMHLKVMRERDA